MDDVVLLGRSSSHFTRVVRIVALELGVTHAFRPVLDIQSSDVDNYAGNPALKLPVLVDEQGSLFGTENICRALSDRSGKREAIVLRGDMTKRVVQNAEELTLHAMSSEVNVIMARFGGSAPSPKVMLSLENALGWLDVHVDEAIAALPSKRTASFLEIALFCTVRHLAFREVVDMASFEKLAAFADRFETRESAQSTPYHVDKA